MYDAKIILDSMGPNGARLTTLELTIPKFILAELNTHRMLGRNSASSRAIPAEKMLGKIEEAPVLPVFWGANQAGMQADVELEGTMLNACRATWRRLSKVAVDAAREMASFGLHKQLANRVVEPWMFTTVVVTATEYSNFFALRTRGKAQREFSDVVDMALELYQKSVPRRLQSGEWHMPYVTGYDEAELRREFADGGRRWGDLDLVEIAVGRCAAVTYLNQEKQDPVKDIERAGKLRGNGHMSPFEHVARALDWQEWLDLANKMAHDWIYEGIPVGNLWGWHQYRKTLKDEHDFGKILKAREGATP